ncbi:MAG: GH3 auxin-responsive promoter family protein, partial [Cyclobacteriaceae bacterium]|nr:GH3 auxin-responsive promoter family protein [Cyclobacteriaceae bacterium]
VKFVNKNPYRVIVTGRIKHFISAFGEHVIGEEVEKAMKLATDKFNEVETIEFTVAPQVTPGEGLPLHEWFVEFSNPPDDMKRFEIEIDEKLQHLNSYYEDLIVGKILRPLKIIPLRKDAFRDYMKSKGKLGGQNKVPRLSNDRQIVDELRTYQL